MDVLIRVVQSEAAAWVIEVDGEYFGPIHSQDAAFTQANLTALMLQMDDFSADIHVAEEALLLPPCKETEEVESDAVEAEVVAEGGLPKTIAEAPMLDVAEEGAPAEAVTAEPVAKTPGLGLAEGGMPVKAIAFAPIADGAADDAPAALAAVEMIDENLALALAAEGLVSQSSAELAQKAIARRPAPKAPKDDAKPEAPSMAVMPKAPRRRKARRPTRALVVERPHAA